MHKKIISILLVVVLLFCLSSCGKPPEQLSNNQTGSVLSKYSINNTGEVDIPTPSLPDVQDVEIPDNYLHVSGDIYAEINEESEIIAYHKLVLNEDTNTKEFKECDAEGNILGDNNKPILKALSLNITNITLTVGDTKELTFATDPVDYDTKGAKWTSSDENVASVKDGKVTAKSSGTATITLTLSDKTSVCTVKVEKKVEETTKPTTEPTTPPTTTNPPPTTEKPKDVLPSSIKLSKTSATVKEGEIVSITATVSPSNASNKTVTWTSSNSNIATVSNGNVVGKKAGTVTITAKTSNGKTASCTVTVTPKEIKTNGITLNKTSLSLFVGDSATLSATVTPNNATNKNVTWSTGNSSVATVSNGKIVAKGVGTTKITAKSSGGQTVTCTVTVTEKVAKFTWTQIKQTDCPLSVSNQFDNYILSSSAKNIAITEGKNTYIMLKASGSNKISVSSVTEDSTGKITVKYSNSGSSNCVFIKINRATSNIVYIR